MAPSPDPAYSAPSGPNATVPIEWLGNCWHQSSTNTCSADIWFPSAVSRDSRPLTTHPFVVPPGGSGQGSDNTPGIPHLGAVPPMTASCV